MIKYRKKKKKHPTFLVIFHTLTVRKSSTGFTLTKTESFMTLIKIDTYP